MLEVVTLEQARDTAARRFQALSSPRTCCVTLDQAAGRMLANDVVSTEGVPPFDRSMVDGFAVTSSDTFGCSEALPALLELQGEVLMGEVPDCSCLPGACVRIPTGGHLPEGANAVVMLEHCEEYGDGTVGVMRPCAPGANVVFKNDDVAPGQVLIPNGTVLQSHHVGTLASLGVVSVEVRAFPRVAIISTGAEIVPPDCMPKGSQMRDVNGPLLAAAVRACGAEAVEFPIVHDDIEQLRDVVKTALEDCQMILVSGGTSAGEKDYTARVFAEMGDVLFHGVAVKPGKPTLLADVGSVPSFGLPGHPVAAYLMFLELARPLLTGVEGAKARTVTARLGSGVPSNHGRTELIGVRLEPCDGDMRAVPIRGKSGLISQLSCADGYVEIGRDSEGAAAGNVVEVRLFERS